MSSNTLRKARVLFLSNIRDCTNTDVMHTNLSISKTTRTEVCRIIQAYFSDNNIYGNMHQVEMSNNLSHLGSCLISNTGRDNELNSRIYCVWTKQDDINVFQRWVTNHVVSLMKKILKPLPVLVQEIFAFHWTWWKQLNGFVPYCNNMTEKKQIKYEMSECGYDILPLNQG